jgi:hypothetical protein
MANQVKARLPNKVNYTSYLIENSNFETWLHTSMEHQNPKIPPQDVTVSEYANRDLVRSCPKCGYAAHRQPTECPARDYTCRICKRFNHFETCCWFKNYNYSTATGGQCTTTECHKSGLDQHEMEFNPPDWYVRTKAWVDHHFGGNSFHWPK